MGKYILARHDAQVLDHLNSRAGVAGKVGRFLVINVPDDLAEWQLERLMSVLLAGCPRVFDDLTEVTEAALKLSSERRVTR